MLLYYFDEWKEAFNAVITRAEKKRAGKRKVPRPPPLHLLVRFATDGGLRGNTAAPCTVVARRIRRKERRLNDAFVQRFTALVRKLVREARRRDASVVVLVDPINSETLRGTGLQGTLLRARKALRNLRRYEGVLLKELRASGKRCPLCGTEGVEVKRTKHARVYVRECCGLKWDRDKGVLYNLATIYFERLKREECNDALTLAERFLTSLKQLLGEHPKALER